MRAAMAAATPVTGEAERAMLGVRFLGHERVAVQEFEDPVPGEGQVLVRIRASALCGSELHAYRGDRALPFNPGHEPAGEVVDASRSKRWQAGDRVGIHAVWGCGRCDWCARGIYTFCDGRGGCPGAHAELMAAPDHVCVPLPDDVPFDVGALLAGDGLGVPYHTSRRLQTRGGNTVAVVGCGPIGLGSVLLQTFFGARVIALDVRPERLEIARELGAALTLSATDPSTLEAVADATQGRLADAVVEATGRPEGSALALKLVGKGGTVACNGENAEVSLHVGRDLIRRDITLFGSWFYHYREFPEMLELLRRGLRADQLITARYPLADAANAFAAFAAGTTAKVVLEP
ncbi:MAG: zinc-binding dehydrogenase [Armatimonadota bacterium]|nr:zinc-binding dehydrogenase [Armatimonadota bacterium]